MDASVKMIIAAVAGIAAGMGIAVMMWIAAGGAVVSCTFPRELAGVTMAVDSQGNASSPWNGTGTGYVCSPYGQWQQLP